MITEEELRTHYPGFSERHYAHMLVSHNAPLTEETRFGTMHRHPAAVPVWCWCCDRLIGDTAWNHALEREFLCGQCFDRLRIVRMKVQAIGRKFQHPS